MKRISSGAAILATLVLAGCGSNSAVTAHSKKSAALPQVTIATANNMLHTAEFVAVEKGFFVKYGVDVKLKVLNTGADISKALQSGTAQFGGTSITSVPTAQQAGLKLAMIVPYMNNAAAAADDDALAVVARSDSGIQPGNWQSFVGKKIGLVKGGTGDEFLTALLTRAGVNPSKVTFLNVSPGDQLTSIESGDVDAIATWEPYQTLILQKMGAKARLIDRDGGALGYVLGLGTTASYRQQHPQTVQKMVDALVATEAWIRGHKSQAAQLDTVFIPGLTASVAKEAIKHLDFDPRVSDCTYKAIQTSTQYLLQQHKLLKSVPPQQQLLSTYVAEAEKTEPQYFRGLPPIPSSCSA